MHVLQAQADLHKLEQHLVLPQELAVLVFQEGVQIPFLQGTPFSRPATWSQGTARSTLERHRCRRVFIFDSAGREGRLAGRGTSQNSMTIWSLPLFSSTKVS